MSCCPPLKRDACPLIAPKDLSLVAQKYRCKFPNAYRDIKIYRRWRAGESAQVLAREFKVSRHRIHAIIAWILERFTETSRQADLPRS